MLIVLFEDRDEIATPLLEALRKHAGTGERCERFKTTTTSDVEASYEDRLGQELRELGFGQATLFVVDRDLSKTDGYRGLTEATVRRVADDFSVPECVYARGESREEMLLQVAEQREACIAVPITDSFDDGAKEVIAIARGFEKLRSAISRVANVDTKMPPGKLLASALGKERAASKLGSYASGDLGRRPGIQRAKGEPKTMERQLTTVLGYWLWDSVLRYPGAMVDEVAASSYLNIDAAIFKADKDIQALFSKAHYGGPFADALGPMWWRSDLDDIVADSEAKDGREFAEKVLKRKVERSHCCDDDSLEAGYTCILSKRPVSLKNSVGDMSWLPRGADLSRICKSKLNELGPWL